MNPHVRAQWKNGRRRWACDYEDGTGRRRQRFFPTREQADDFLAEAIKESRQKRTPDLPPDITVAEYFRHWFGLLQLKRHSRDAYETQFRVHLLPAFGETRVRDVRRSRLKAFFAEKLARLKPGTVRLMHSVLNTLLNAAVEDEIILANPAAKLGRALKLVVTPRARTEEIKAMDRAQRDRFLATAQKVAPWWAPMWAVQVRTGLRPGEVFGLREEDLDLERGTARIDRQLADDGKRIEETPKSGMARTIDLSAQTIAFLRAHLVWRREQKLKGLLKELPEPLFCGPDGGYAKPSEARKAFVRVLEAAGLPRFSPHGLRHTYASMLLTAGRDVYYVSRMLGHARIQETVDTYGRWLPANRPGALDVLDDAPATAPAEAAG